MAEPFLGQITIFAGNFAPRGWALCDGQLLPIAPNTALFSLLGTAYGGDGETTFALPDLRGRAPIHEGNGPGLSDRRLGQKSGRESHTEVPSHTHNIAVGGEADRTAPSGNHLAQAASYSDAAGAGNLGGVGSTGQSSVDHMPPFLVVNYIIALQGLFPSED